MRGFLNIFFFVFFTVVVRPVTGQVVTSDPDFPLADQPVTIFFDATEGDAGLKDYSGDVYAHTGVLIAESVSGSDWRYVKTAWGENTPETRLERISQNLYSLEIGPSIREYYGVPAGDEITHLAFVFRCAESQLTGRDETGGDIFVEVYEAGLNIRILSPAEKITVTTQDEYLELEAIANEADTMAVYVDGAFLAGTGPGDEISVVLPTLETGNHLAVVWAANANEQDRDTLSYLVRDETLVEERPEGIIDGINYIDENSVILSVYAPLKEHILVIGDFTGWQPDERYLMKKTPDGTHFWIGVDGLSPGKIYCFHYLLDGTLVIPDPNTGLLVDPQYDRWISEETFPGITALYQGLPQGQFSVIQTGRTEYSWQSEDFTPPDPEDLVIYELLVRDFIAAHDWKTLADTLDYLEYLGINAIELMPVNEFNGNESWGYNPNYWMCPDKYYGPPDDLKFFIDECHRRGIAVILDIVFNHVETGSAYSVMYRDEQGYPSEDNPWLNPDFDPDDPRGEYQARHPYSVFFDFDHSKKATRDLMDRSTRFWMQEYRVDGFRFDLTKGFTQRSTYLGTDNQGNALYDEGRTSSYDPQRVEWLERMADTIRTFNPGAYVILEHFCDNTEEKELADHGMMLWGNLNYSYNEATMGYHDSGKSNFSSISYKKRGWNDPNLVGYMESHDEERLMYKNLQYGNASGSYNIQDLETALQRMELAGAFFFTIPGPKMIWQFGELGYDWDINYGCRTCNKPIRWDYYSDPGRRLLYETWTALIRLRKAYSAFHSRDFDLYLSGAWKRIEINDPDMDIRIVGNFGVERMSVDPDFSSTGWWYDFFSGDSVQVEDVNRNVVLNPGQFHIFTTKPVFRPAVSKALPVFLSEEEKFFVWPNPAGNTLNFNPIEQESTLTFTDLGGHVALIRELEPLVGRTELNPLPEGVFIIIRTAEGRDPSYAKIFRSGR